jgi:alginate O-acetyltransferase complex protein AlgI
MASIVGGCGFCVQFAFVEVQFGERSAAMVFSSQLFLFYFLPLSLAVYYALPASPQRLRNLWLVLTGYVFYGWAEPRFVALMFGTTSLDWMLSLVIARDRWRFWQGEGPVQRVVGVESGRVSATRRWALRISVGSNLAALGFFKYFNFGMESWNQLAAGLGWDAAVWEGTLRVVLPLGISFYTFQALSYIVDVYRGDAEAMADFIDFSCFVSMFPHLVAGPILKFSFLAEQLKARTVTAEKAARGVAFFLMGLGKKVLVANPCGKLADGSFEAATRGVLEAWVGAVGYALQIYFDFSGYSDMAIGLGLLFGFTFARNFNAPYAATSLTEFWKRWHISLSTWLREYVYIPLGGNRQGPWRTARNLAGTMLLGGLWHGASWNFLVWGGLHGGVLVLERFGFLGGTRRLPGWVGWLGTQAVVLVGWVFFRAPTLGSALEYLRSMGLGCLEGPASTAIGLRQPYLMGSLVLAGLLVAFGVQTWDWTQRLNGWKTLAIAGVGLSALVALLTQDYNPFLYFIF